MPAKINLPAFTAAVVKRLTDAGVRATDDPRNVNPPCVLVMPPVVTWRMKGADLAFPVFALAGDTGTPQATKALSKLLDGVRDALGGRVTGGTPVDVAVSEGATLPGYQITYTARTCT